MSLLSIHCGFQIDWMKFFGKMMSVTNITLTADEPIVSFSSDFLRKMSALVTDKLRTEEGRRYSAVCHGNRSLIAIFTPLLHAMSL